MIHETDAIVKNSYPDFVIDNSLCSAKCHRVAACG